MAAFAPQQGSPAFPPPLDGELFLYEPTKRLCAFRAATPRFDPWTEDCVVVFVGGLTDGFLCAPYVAQLPALVAAACRPMAVPDAARGRARRPRASFVQALLSSSYTGYGHSSIAQDAAELDALLAALDARVAAKLGRGTNRSGHEDDDDDGGGRERERSSGSSGLRFVLVGHSTGCQDVVALLARGGPRARRVVACVLQAPVSDREYMRTLPVDRFAEHFRTLGAESGAAQTLSS